MFITSSTRIDGAQEIKRLGPVTGEYVIQENIYRAILDEIRRYDEIRTQAYEEELAKAKEAVMEEMTKKAESLGANAIIGMNMFQEVIGYGRMMLVAGTGTAAYVDGADDI